MDHRRWVAALAAAAVLAGACSQRGPNQTVASPGATSTVQASSDDVDNDILYVQHALFGTTANDETGSTITLAGVDQVTAWTTADDGGTMTTAEFIDSWNDLGLGADNPQAAFIPASTSQSPVVIELSDPAWDAERRTITYRVRTVGDPQPRLAGMVTDRGATLPTAFTVATLLISQPDADEVPESTVTTTTTTTTTPPDSAPTETAAPDTPGTSPRSTTRQSPSPQPQPGPSPVQPPTRPAQITFSPSSLNFPVSGGLQTVQLSNVGGAVGSWSMSPEIGTDITASPVGGYLLPGSSVFVSIQYNGQGPNSDFATEIDLRTSNGNFTIRVVVG